MGEATDLFEDLRDRGNGKAGEAHSTAAEPVGAAEPAAPSAPPAAHDLEAPLLANQGIQDPTQLPPVLLAAPPESDPLLYVCRVLSIVTAVGALLCLVVNAISLLRSFDYRGFDYRVSVCFASSFRFVFIDPLSSFVAFQFLSLGFWCRVLPELANHSVLQGIKINLGFA